MKKSLLLLSMFVGATTFAQSPKKIVLKKGQELTISSSSSSDSELGMGQSMKNISNSSNKLIVLSEDDQSYKVVNTITNMKMNIEGLMGQKPFVTNF